MRLSHLFPDAGIRGLIVSYERDAAQRLQSLTPAERIVLEQMLDGHPNKIIAFRLNRSQRTIENQRLSIFEKTGAKSLVDLLRLAILADIETRGFDAYFNWPPDVVPQDEERDGGTPPTQSE